MIKIVIKNKSFTIRLNLTHSLTKYSIAITLPLF